MRRDEGDTFYYLLLGTAPSALTFGIMSHDPNSSTSLSPGVAFLGWSHHGGLNMHPCVHGKHLHSCHPKDCFSCWSPLAFDGQWHYLASCFLLPLAGKWTHISMFPLHPVNPQVILVLPSKSFSNGVFHVFSGCHFSSSIFSVFFFLTYLVLLKPTLHTAARIINKKENGILLPPCTTLLQGIFPEAHFHLHSLCP